MADRALLLGINDYKSISDLNGCVNDVRNIKRLLTETYEFPAENIVELIDHEVVKTNILAKFGEMIAASTAGDRLVFHYSGHGSYKPSDNDDEPIDEFICLWDMDWHDSNSFLIDDDLGDLLKEVAAGVHLSVILDCCHSGTGTRAMPPIGAKPGQRAIQGMKSADHPVLARFVIPPAEFRLSAAALRKARAKKKAKTRGGGEMSLNHQLLASASDEQTAADAYIGNDFNGAFSYYFCEAARKAGPVASARSVFDAAKTLVKNRNYSQDPQLEGPFGEIPLFGGQASEGGGGGETGGASKAPGGSGSSAGSGDPLAAAAGALARGGNQDNLDRLLRIGEMYFALCSQAAGIPVAGIPGVAGVLAGGVPSGRGFVTGDPTAEEWVAVHGISKHLPGYSDKWRDAMAPHITKNLTQHEVRWSQHVNSERSLGGDADREAAELQAEINAELEQRKEQIFAEAGAAGPVPGTRWVLDDFTRYMLSETTRELILGEFTTVMRPLLQSGKPIHLVSHSWGTVVAYEGLRRLESEGAGGNICNFFVAGAGLSIGAVRLNLRGRLDNLGRPGSVKRWINLDARGDIVGGDLAGHFDVDAQFLGLDAPGCFKLLGVPVMPCPHSSYFNEKNTAVTRNIFGAYINDAC